MGYNLYLIRGFIFDIILRLDYFLIFNIWVERSYCIIFFLFVIVLKIKIFDYFNNDKKYIKGDCFIRSLLWFLIFFCLIIFKIKYIKFILRLCFFCFRKIWNE